jgi:hypothetical protein
LGQCTRSANQTKLVTRHVWEDCRERLDAHRLTHEGRRIYKRRKETIERSFADAKELHGHRYMRMRGLLRAQEQCLLAAACQNLKKMALILCREEEKGKKGHLRQFLSRVIGSCRALFASAEMLSPFFHLSVAHF